MERFVKGDIIIIPFPFSNLIDSKKRPALIIGKIEKEEIILCQITSKKRFDKYSVSLDEADFKKGNLHLSSYIRPNKLFTADKSIAIKKAGTINESKYKEVISTINKIINY